MKMLKVLALVAGIMLLAAPAQARQAMGVHEKIVDGFVYLVDNSGSMLMKHEGTGIQKIEMAKRIMQKINSNVPALDYDAAIALFSPNATVLPATSFDNTTFSNAVSSINNKGRIFGRLTSMDKSISEMAGTVSQVSGTKAIYLISDGLENLGGNPYQVASALNGTVHVISVADSVEGVQNLKAIANANSNAQFIDGAQFLAQDKSGERLVSSTLYVKTIPSQSVASMQEILFNVGKHDILPKYATVLDGMAEVMVTRPDLKIFVEGYADPTGDSGSNQSLSERRAQAVKNYLVGAGVYADQIIALGRGENDKYPSYQLDRRVEVMIIWE